MLDAPVLEITTASLDAIVYATLKSVFWECKYSIPGFFQVVGGAIVGDSSVSSSRSRARMYAYPPAKAAIFALTRSVAVECAAKNIRADILVPGFVPLTEGRSEDFLQISKSEFLRTAQALPLGTPPDLAYAALFLASSESAYVAGTRLVVDGGAASMSGAASRRELKRDPQKAAVAS